MNKLIQEELQSDSQDGWDSEWALKLNSLPTEQKRACHVAPCKESACQCRSCRRSGFDPWVGKIPWRRAWQPTPVFLPGEALGQRSLAGYSPWGHKESDTTEQLSTHTCSRQDIHLVTPTTDLATLLKINSTARSMKSSLWQEGQIDLIFTLGLNSPSTKCLMDPNIQSINIYISMGPHLLKCLILFLLALKLMGKQGI